MAQEAFLSLHDAVVRRAGKNILEIEDFRLEFGQHLALLGPNGAGKSTFIQLITREVLPLYREDPAVLFMGNPRATLAQVKQTVGMVSSTMQDQITVHLPALEIVVGGLYGTLGLPHGTQLQPADAERARQIMEELGVGDLADRDVMTLSTGQARRVLIARALIHGPKVLVLDEPCTGLDPAGMFHVRKSMRKLAQKGVTLVLVTHYPEDIVPEIDRLVMLKNGKVFADGSKQELMTDEAMTALFEVPLQTSRTGEYFSLVSAY
ncbi:MAG: ATP-binding cassette domain-containing protein [Coriobacteriia bacterium]|nr:ATP-binding cassette domain-containing protein [Coriobacteriia bacterium]